MWFPRYNQLRYWRNASYLNSLWLGTVWAVLMIPEIIWHYYPKLIADRPSIGWLTGTIMTGLSICRLFLAGVFGQLSAENISQEEQEKRLRDTILGPNDDV